MWSHSVQPPKQVVRGSEPYNTVRNARNLAKTSLSLIRISPHRIGDKYLGRTTRPCHGDVKVQGFGTLSWRDGWHDYRHRNCDPALENLACHLFFISGLVRILHGVELSSFSKIFVEKCFHKAGPVLVALRETARVARHAFPSLTCAKEACWAFENWWMDGIIPRLWWKTHASVVQTGTLYHRSLC